jgi:hypothetical protein
MQAVVMIARSVVNKELQFGRRTYSRVENASYLIFQASSFMTQVGT